MGVTSYPTDVDVVSTDIELVGGKNAQVGMVREDNMGRRFILVVAGGTISAGVGIVNGGNAFSEGSDAASPFHGVNTTGGSLSSGDYFWMQTYGLALNSIATDTNVVDLDLLTGAASNVSTGHSTVTTSTGQNFFGWAIGDDVDAVCAAFINPGAVGDTHAAE